MIIKKKTMIRNKVHRYLILWKEGTVVSSKNPCTTQSQFVSQCQHTSKNISHKQVY